MARKVILDEQEKIAICAAYRYGPLPRRWNEFPAGLVAFERAFPGDVCRPEAADLIEGFNREMMALGCPGWAVGLVVNQEITGDVRPGDLLDGRAVEF